MRNAMVPIIGKIISKNDKYKTPPGERNGKKSKMLVNVKKSCQYYSLAQKTQKHITQPHTNGRKSIFRLIGLDMMLDRID